MMDRLLTAGLCGNTIGQDIQTLTYHSSTSNMAFHLKDVCRPHGYISTYGYISWPLNRGDSRVSGYPGLSPKIQDLLLLHIDDWPVYMKFIMCICQSEVRASVGGS